jgi:hypothetical protein
VYTDLLLFLRLPLPGAHLFAKSQIKNSWQRKTPDKEASLPRAIKNTQHRFLCREANGWLSAKKF